MSDKAYRVSARLPKDWVEEIDREASEKGLTRTDIVKMAIAQYLGKAEPNSDLGERVSQLEVAIARIQQTLERQPLDAIRHTERQSNVFPASDPKQTSVKRQQKQHTERRSSVSQPSAELERRARECGLTVEEVRAMFPWLG